MARPKVATLRELYAFRLLPEEREQIEIQADRVGLTVSEFIRRRALGHKIVPRIEERYMNELRRQGGLLKRLIVQSPQHRAELNALLKEIIATLQTVRSSAYGGH